MKKFLLLVVAVMLGFGTMFANPVSMQTAMSLGQKFVLANFENTNTADLQLVTVVNSDNGDACFYVFNVGESAFVIVSATDNVHPILAYSEESAFNTGNQYNGAMYMLDTYKNSISYAIEEQISALPEIEREWTLLEKSGRLSNKRAETVGPLVLTKWNQDSPYNYYAPAASGGPGGRAYAGCVATAMSQLMKRWDAPLHGQGSHSYYWHGQQLSANFGATTYDWANMPTTLTGANQTQIEAVALLMYHCGIAVNMNYSADGSGAYSDDVPGAMNSYFDYDYCQKKSRQSYQLDVWNQMLKTEFDLGRPVYYSGSSSDGGHAFVCDGYDETDHMHFNFGWSGSDDGWYLVDAIDFNSGAGAIFNFVPTNVYENTVQAPSNFTVERASETALQATLSWKNPNKNMSGMNVTSIDAIVIERNGEVIAELPGQQVGANVTYTDENVPCYSTFTYSVYAMKDGVRGNNAEAVEAFGPSNSWKFILTASSMQGWRGGSIKCYDAANNMFNKVTVTSSSPVTMNIDVPFGHDVKFVWKAGTSTDGNMTVKIKNESGTVVYEYSGSMADLDEGVVFATKNNGSGTPAAAPSNINAVRVGEDILVTWDGQASQYGFNVYRDDELYALVKSANEFVDVAPEVGGYCYRVTNFGTGGESASTYDACATAGEGCNPATELWYYAQDNLKPVITWTKPVETTQTLSGYYIFRKDGDDGEYKQIKILGPNKTEYKESQTLVLGTYYSYKVIAYYQDIDCKSAPAKAKYGNEFFLRYHYSQTGVEENVASMINVYPNPAKDVLTVKADNINNISIFSMVGQRVFSEDVNANEVVINMSDFEAGMYVIRVKANGTEMIKRISVIR